MVRDGLAHVSRPFRVGGLRHPACSGLSVWLNEKASKTPFDGNPYTRLAGADQAMRLIWHISADQAM